MVATLAAAANEVQQIVFWQAAEAADESGC